MANASPSTGCTWAMPLATTISASSPPKRIIPLSTSTPRQGQKLPDVASHALRKVKLRLPSATAGSLTDKRVTAPHTRSSAGMAKVTAAGNSNIVVMASSRGTAIAISSRKWFPK